MLTVLLFISALPLFNLTMRWYLYIPVSFFSIVLAALIIKIKDKSRFAYLLLVAYLMIFILGSVLNYKIWLNNAQIGKEVVNGLEDQIKMNDNIETIAILNFPSKEIFNTDRPLSFYAATKKSNEVMAYSYSNIYLPLSCYRLFWLHLLHA